VAVSVTAVPLANACEQGAPQSIPAGELVTVPDPLPDLTRESVTVGVNVAVTVLSASMGTVQVPGPEQPPPDQPVKTEPDAGVAVSVTEAPAANEPTQVLPQLTPAGELVTVPLPASRRTVSDVPGVSW
jgi:hypothetical protein